MPGAGRQRLRIATAFRSGSATWGICFCLGFLTARDGAWAVEPVPEKLVVLTFDDSVKSHFTVARPLLKRYGFGATFFVTEGLSYRKNPAAYMTWQEIRTLHDDGFEIGNHLLDHMAVSAENVPRLAEQLQGIDDRCAEHGIPRPVSFAWPACVLHRDALPILKEHGIRWGRRCTFPEFPLTQSRGFAYEPERDHPCLIPCAAIPGPGWTLVDFQAAVRQATAGEVSVVLFHGVPETEHPWVNTPRDRFEEFLNFLHTEEFRVIAMRDLEKYVDPDRPIPDPWESIERRRSRFSDETRIGK